MHNNSKSSNSAQQRKPQQATPAAEAPYNAGDPKSVAGAEKRKRMHEALRRAGLGEIMGSKAGRAWMYWLLEEMAPMNNAFTGNSATFFNCGKQYIGQHLVAQLLEEHLDAYVLMCKEHRVEPKKETAAETDPEEEIV
jgi:hypothetical protein